MDKLLFTIGEFDILSGVSKELDILRNQVIGLFYYQGIELVIEENNDTFTTLCVSQLLEIQKNVYSKENRNFLRININECDDKLITAIIQDFEAKPTKCLSKYIE